MRFLGSSLSQKRNFYTQNNNFWFSASCLVNSTSGEYKFGISGDAGSLEFTMGSGKIYFKDKFVHTYNANKSFYIECALTKDTYNIMKDGIPMIFGDYKSSGNFDYLYMSRSSSSLIGNFNFNIYGQNSPNISISKKGYLFSSEQDAVTGYLNNNGSYPFRVFSSSATQSQDLFYSNPSGNILPNTGLSFIFSGIFTSFNFEQPVLVNFDTNFNTLSSEFYIVDTRSLDNFVFLQDINDFTFNYLNQVNRNLFYTNYSGGIQTYDFPANLSFTLNYITGSGTFAADNIVDGIDYSTNLYGSFSESGILTGIFSQPISFDNLNGNYVVNLNEFSWATGWSTGTFSGQGTGLATGIGYSGAAAGGFTGQVSVYINDGSGTFLFDSVASGYGIAGLSVDYPGYINATGYLTVNSLRNGDFFYIGTLDSPIMKGIQFNNETGLVYYLSGAPEHQVSSYASGSIIFLSSLSLSGTRGNGILVQPNSCNIGTMSYSSLTGGINIGSTGNTVFPISPYFGQISQTITGSGNYVVSASGFGQGIFYYTKTFTGQWDILTGINSQSLISIKTNPNITSTSIQASGIFPPNSYVNFQVNHLANQYSTDTSALILSGSSVLNPIYTTLTN